MVDVARARKLAVRIREVVASTLEMQVKDPRLGMVTITDAKVTPDLREATLYYTVFGTPEEQQSSAMALESAKGVLRATVAKARAEDARVHEQAGSAVPAGDADPYRAPRLTSDEDDEE
jgi:ribosome-binding factor A